MPYDARPICFGEPRVRAPPESWWHLIIFRNSGQGGVGNKTVTNLCQRTVKRKDTACPSQRLKANHRPDNYGKVCAGVTVLPNEHVGIAPTPPSVTGRVERRRAGLDQWLPLYLPFRASWQMAIRSCPRFLHPLGSFHTAGSPGWKPAWSSCTLPKPSPASFDAGPAFLSVSGSVSRRLGSRLYPQALGSARFIIPAPAIATTA